MPIELTISVNEVITRDLGEPVGRGLRKYWRCPFHDDTTPSLTLMPDGQRWKCFGCGTSGDAIDWVKERQGVSFREAVKLLDGSLDSLPLPSCTPPRRPPGQAIKRQPDSDWAQRAADVVEECCKQLQSIAGAKALEWLSKRGLAGETLCRWRIGFNLRDQKISGHFVPKGVVIPWIEDDSVRAIKIRRPNLNPKYVCVQGSCPSGLFLSQGIRAGYCTLIVEGEFDALLGWQEASDQINVCTIGSASESPGSGTLIRLIESPLILLCYDNDDAGSKGMARWSSVSQRVRSVRLPMGKDLTEFYEQGGDISAWVRSLLQNYSTRQPDTRQLG